MESIFSWLRYNKICSIKTHIIRNHHKHNYNHQRNYVITIIRVTLMIQQNANCARSVSPQCMCAAGLHTEHHVSTNFHLFSRPDFRLFFFNQNNFAVATKIIQNTNIWGHSGEFQLCLVWNSWRHEDNGIIFRRLRSLRLIYENTVLFLTRRIVFRWSFDRQICWSNVQFTSRKFQ